MDYIRVYDLTAPFKLSITCSNNSCMLIWPRSIVCHLQAQTNAAGPIGTWYDVPAAANPYVVPAGPGVSSVFYRLQSP